MSDDLISRKALYERVEKSMYENPYSDIKVRQIHNHEHAHFLRMIMQEPTAFDKEKVIEKINEESRAERLEDVSISGNVYGYNIERVINEEDVIEIIEKGGIECDFM